MAPSKPTIEASLRWHVRHGDVTPAQLEALAGPEWGLAESWDEEYERNLAALAMQRVQGEVQPATWQAFWKTAVEGPSPRETGEALGMSPGAVYVARSRVLARLKEEVQWLQEED